MTGTSAFTGAATTNGITNTGNIGTTTLAVSGATITHGIDDSFSGITNAGAVTGVTAGALNATSTDAVNGSQLYATNQNVAANTSSIAALQNGLALETKQERGGIAAALALGGTFLPPGKTLAMSFNLATYRGEQGFSGAIVGQVAPNVYLNAGFAGSTVKGSVGARAGITFGW